jgi:hypothetical protein
MPMERLSQRAMSLRTACSAVALSSSGAAGSVTNTLRNVIGTPVGAAVGAAVGGSVGSRDGATVGRPVGAAVLNGSTLQSRKSPAGQKLGTSHEPSRGYWHGSSNASVHGAANAAHERVLMRAFPVLLLVQQFDAPPGTAEQFSPPHTPHAAGQQKTVCGGLLRMPTVQFGSGGSAAVDPAVGARVGEPVVGADVPVLGGAGDIVVPEGAAAVGERVALPGTGGADG